MATRARITDEELVSAGRVLFGRSFSPAAPSWHASLRDVYRRRALETHPDRAQALGRSEAELARDFRAVAEAYRVLSAAAGAPRGAAGGVAPQRRAAPPARAPRRPAPAPGATRREAASRGAAAAPAPAPSAPFPHRRLRLAEFLYYTGRIPWSALASAIAWQRAQRPPLGRIAMELGFLAQADVAAILARRRAEGAMAEPFGEYALRAGFLTRLQLLAAIGRQGRLQRRIGEYFVEHRLLDAAALDAARAELFARNARFSAARRSPRV